MKESIFKLLRSVVQPFYYSFLIMPDSLEDGMKIIRFEKLHVGHVSMSVNYKPLNNYSFSMAA